METRSFKVNKIKYDKEWEEESTKKWMNESWDQLTTLCKETNVDYQRYSAEDFARLEEQIATYVFGITKDRAERAQRSNNLLSAYDDSQRRFATEARRKMEEIAGGRVVDVQVVPIYVLYVEQKKEKETPSSQCCVFRVRNKDGCWKFVDRMLRIYSNFDDYLKQNKEPRCMMCYPADGFLRARQKNKDTNANTFTASEVHFGEPPSCTLSTTEQVDEVTAAVGTLTAVAAVFTPAGPLAATLACISLGTIGYSLVRQGANIVDKGTHGEKYGTELFHFAITIATLVLSRALPKYLRLVVRSGRQLTFFESAVITLILRGMTAINAANLANMIYQFGVKLANQPKEITAMDVLNLVVAAHSMYSCWMSPKSAKAMLEQAKQQVYAENKAKIARKDRDIKRAQESNKVLQEELKKIKESGLGDIEMIKNLEKKIQANDENIEKWGRKAQAMFEKFFGNSRNPKTNVDEIRAFTKKKQNEVKNMRKQNKMMERELKELRSTGDLNRIDELENKIASNKKKIDRLNKETLSAQKEYMKKICKGMENRGAREAYKKFVKKERKNWKTNTEIDQNDRIIQAVTHMDAEEVFRLVSATKSEICFANGETLDLLINNQLEVHPSAIDQMNRTYATKLSGTTSDLQETMRLTRQFDTGQITKETYLKHISNHLQKYQMMTKAEIAEVHKDIMQRMGNISDMQMKLFENMRPSVAFRMRTVLKGTSNGDLEAAVKIAESLNVMGCPFDVANCVEVVKLHFDNELKAFELKKAKINGNGDMSAENKQNAINKLYEEHFGLSGEDMRTVSNSNISNKDKTEFLAERFAHNVANNDQQRAALVQHISKRMNDIAPYAEAELFYGDLLSAYYHVEKHSARTVMAFYDETNTQAPQNPLPQKDIDKIYFKEMKDHLFNKKNYRSALISQDGQMKTRVWATEKKYTGFTKAPNAPYENLLGNSSIYFPGEFIASHFQK